MAQERPIDPTHAFLTPGQGSQRVGMGLELANRSEAAMGVWTMADAKLQKQLGYKLTDVVWNGTTEQLKLTQNAQLAVVTDSLARAAAYRESGLLDKEPGYHAGNSVGFMAAAVNAGALSVESAVQIAAGRGAAFRHAIDTGEKTTLTAFNGVDADLRGEVAERYGLSVCLINTPEQYVLGGPVSQVEAAVAEMKEKHQMGDRVYQIPVDAAFHSEAMRHALPLWTEVLDAAQINDPRPGVKLVGGSTVTEIATATALREEFKLQLTQTERYAEVVARLAASGVTTFSELNNTATLTKMHVTTLGGGEHQRVVYPVAVGGEKGIIMAHNLVITAAEKPAVAEALVEEKVSKDEIAAFYIEWMTNRTDVEDLGPNSHFVDDGEADSEDLVALRAAVRKRFGKNVPDDEAEKNVTIGMAVEATYKLVNS